MFRYVPRIRVDRSWQGDGGKGIYYRRAPEDGNEITETDHFSLEMVLVLMWNEGMMDGEGDRLVSGLGKVFTVSIDRALPTKTIKAHKIDFRLPRTNNFIEARRILPKNFLTAFVHGLLNIVDKSCSKCNLVY